jgi:hypothetical protein
MTVVGKPLRGFPTLLHERLSRPAFNVMEHRFAVSDIAEFLNDNKLTFLGFELPADVNERFQQQYQGRLL